MFSTNTCIYMLLTALTLSTSLLNATYTRKYNAVDALQEAGYKVYFKAATEGDVEKLARMIDKHTLNIDTDFEDSFDGSTALHIAAIFSHVNIAQELLRRKATITKRAMNAALRQVRDNNQDSPAAQVLRLFIAHNGRFDVNEQEYRTAVASKVHSELMQAAILNNTVAIRALFPKGIIALFKKKINVNEALDGMTALHFAAAQGNTDVIRILLEQQGIDINLVNNEGLTAQLLAERNGHTEAADVIRAYGILYRQPSRTPAILIGSMVVLSGK
jgi:ankyrin repeat protein